MNGLNSRSLLIGVAAGALIAAAVSGAILYRMRKGHDAPSPAFEVQAETVRLKVNGPRPVSFETTAVSAGAPLAKAPVTARVAAVETKTAPSFAPIDGRIERTAVVLGDRVHPGQHLVLVRSGDLAAMLKDLRAGTSSAETKKALVERMKVLVDSHAASENELLIAQNELREAELAARAADFRLKSLAVSEDADNLYWIIASRSGTVIQLDATPGQQVGPGRDKPVATVADLSEVMVLADLPQQDVVGLSAGMSAEIRIPGSENVTFTGKIETVSEVVDAERQTVPIRVRVDNSDRSLRPNAFVEATFATDIARKVLLVPAASVVTDGTRSFVFVEAESGVFHRRDVVLGRQHAGQCEILSGVKADERVVSRGALLLLNAIVLDN